MDESKKPAVGQGLNKAAEETLLNIKCIDKKTRKQFTEGERVEKYKTMLKRKAEAQGAEFVSFDPVKGEWKLRSSILVPISSAMKTKTKFKVSSQCDSVKISGLSGSVKFEVYEKDELVLSGTLEMLSGSNGKGWNMNCEAEITAGSGFLKEKHIIEVYVTGCFS